MAPGAIWGAEMGLLDRMDDPATMGLLSLGMGLLGSRGSFGNALAQAGPQAMQAMRQVKQDKTRQAQMEQAQKLQDLQMQQAQMAIAQQQAQQQRQTQADNMRGGFLNSIDPSAGPAMPFNPVSAMRAGLNASEIETLAPQSNKPLIVDGNVLDPTTLKTLWSAPPKPAAPSDIAKLTAEMAALPPGSPLRPVYEDAIRKATTHAPAASAVSYGSPVPIMLPDGSIGYAQPGNKAGAAPQVMAGADGRPLVKPGEAEKPLTEGQAKALAYASRMQSADQTLAELARSGTRASIPGSMQNNSVGDVLTALAPADQQRLNQAKRDFVNATLRRESGAVISPEEFSNADRQYFPQVLDSRPVIEQKAKNRRTALEGIKADVPTAKRSEVDRISESGATDGVAFDPEKERRYQEWKRKQGQ